MSVTYSRYARLTPSSLIEKVPEREGVYDKADLITDQQLSADRPPEEAKVAWMSEISIQATSHQHVSLLVFCGDDVIEISARLLHGDTSDRLANDHQGQARCNSEWTIDQSTLVSWEEVGKDNLDACSSVCSGVMAAIVEEKKA